MTFGQRLKMLRLARGWKQEKLAAISGIHQAMISNLEKDKHTPTLDTAAALAQALDVPVDALARDEATTSGRAPAWVLQFERYGRYLSAAQRESIIELVRSLAGQPDGEEITAHTGVNPQVENEAADGAKSA